ncbi:MAG TPA: fatty acid desaturase [Pyrinomonadaceae bacterium]|jgi:stearoyl-CoA desaturase (delta-9 desaturase)
MRTYNLIGYSLLVLHIVASAVAAPPEWGVATGVVVGLIYLVFIWFVGGLYLTDILHMGIAHKTLAYKRWFIQSVTLLYNTAGIYVNPTTWVNRHRHHHAFSDHEHDPNKHADDGFWKTLYLCFFPYTCKSNLAQDSILKTAPFRVVSNAYFAIFAQFSSYGLLLLMMWDWVYALTLWISVRILGLWLNMVQNYWTHDRRFGTRRYVDDDDNAMNLTDWLPVTASFSSSLQNNHHHYPNFLRTSHVENEYDFGFLTVRAMKKIGLVTPTSIGAQKPEDVALQEVGL